MKNYTENNKNRVDENKRRWYLKNKEKIAEKNKKNKPKRNKNRNERYKNDSQYNIRFKLRHRIIDALKKREISKSDKTIKLLGCDFAFYKNYLEALFTEGMTWELLRTGKIHIDHIKPCASFDLTKPEEQKACFHYLNTQPLWAFDNYSKKNKITA